MTMLLLLLACRLLFAEANTNAPLCSYAYSACDPQDVTLGVCMDAPGEQCYTDSSNIVYCCVPEPTTGAPVTTAAPAPGPGCATPTPSPPFSGSCVDVLRCCTTALCTSYRNEMIRLCPQTCGFCTAPAVPPPPADLKGCSNSDPNCRNLASYCYQAGYESTMKSMCPYTCNYCSPCIDNSVSCAEWVKNGFCTSTTYSVTHIRSFCAYSCGYCGAASLAPPPTTPKPAAPPCVDTNANCPTWVKNSFCTSTYYTPAVKKDYCAKSCNLC